MKLKTEIIVSIAIMIVSFITGFLVCQYRLKPIIIEKPPIII